MEHGLCPQKDGGNKEKTSGECNIQRLIEICETRADQDQEHRIAQEYQNGNVGGYRPNCDRQFLEGSYAEGARTLDEWRQEVFGQFDAWPKALGTGLVATRKEGLYVFYRVAGDDVIELLGSLRRTGERHTSEVNRVIFGYFNERDSLEAISREELLQRSRDGLVTVLDVRPPEEYQTGHIPGAVNMPVEEIEKRLGILPKDQEIIAYCRGSYCVFAFEAVAALRKNGFDARRLEEGYPEWKAAGLPVENGPP